jgi:type II secretory pathway pseudopilin PulG
MSDEGYTLAETLAAVAMIGMAITGLGQGMFVIAQYQGAANATIAREQAARAADQGLRRLLFDSGPFRAPQNRDGFVGRADGFDFECGQDAACGAAVASSPAGARVTFRNSSGVERSIVLPGVRSARFTYAAAGASGGQWPPASPENQLLRTVALVETPSGAPLAVAKLWIDHETPCAFDAVLSDCGPAS